MPDEEKPKYFVENIPYEEFFKYADAYEHNAGKKNFLFSSNVFLLKQTQQRCSF